MKIINIARRENEIRCGFSFKRASGPTDVPESVAKELLLDGRTFAQFGKLTKTQDVILAESTAFVKHRAAVNMALNVSEVNLLKEENETLKAEIQKLKSRKSRVAKDVSKPVN